MPDTDPTTPGDATSTGPQQDAAPTTSAPATPADAADGTAPPPAKAPRRRRASTAAGAPAPNAASEETSSPAPTADVAAEQVADAAAAADAPAPVKRTPRKRTPRKKTADTAADSATDAAPGAADDAAVAAALADAEPVVEAVEDDPVVQEDVLGDVTVPETTFAAEPPARRTRAPRAPVAVAFQAPPADEDEAEVAPPPRRRRRAGTAGAVSPSELVPTLIEPATDDDEEELDDAAAAEAGDTDSDSEEGARPRRRRRGRRGRGRRPEGEAGDDDTDESGDDEVQGETGTDAEGADDSEDGDDEDDDGTEGSAGTRRRRRRRRRSGGGGGGASDDADEEPGTVVHVREPRQARVRGAGAADEDGVRGISGSTRMAAKRVRRQEGRDSGRRRQPILSEAEFLARREAVDRDMVVRQKGDRTQIAVLEDGVLVEHYVTRTSAQSFAGNVYLGRVQNVLPSMEAAFVDIGKGRNAVLYAGEVNWAELGGHHRKIESALKSGQEVLAQVTKEPIGQKGARLTGQVSLPGRYLVYVPEGSMTGISRKLPDKERDRLKAILKKVVPDDAGVIIRTAAEGASEEELAGDVRRLQAQWEVIKTKAAQGGAPKLLHAEPDLVIRVIRDVFNEDFRSLVVQGDSEWETIRDYVEFVAPDLAARLSRFTAEGDVFSEHRIDEQLAKALDRKVYLPSGGSLVIDRTEAMVVIDVNTGKYTGEGGNLEETVTRNNLEAAEEIARQLRLRDLGGIVVVDFIDMVLESNRDLVVRRLAECMARDRTKHQVAEVTSLGLVQMTRKRVGQGLLESFSEPCEVCNGRGVLVSSDPVEQSSGGGEGRGRGRGRRDEEPKGRSRGKGDDESAGGRSRGKGDDESAGGRSRGRSDDARAKADDGGGARAKADDAGRGTDSEPAAEAGEGTGGRRRRRGGRGSGAATVAPSDELAELMADAPPDIADQPSSAEEDLPVVPVLGEAAEGDDATVAAPDDADDAADDADAERAAGAVDAVAGTAGDEPTADPQLSADAVQVDDAPQVGGEVDVESAVTDGSGPGSDDAAPTGAGARPRRRRATSRPAGPPSGS